MSFSIDAQLRAIDRLTGPVNKMQKRLNRFTRVSGLGFKRLNQATGQFSANILKTGAAVGTGALSIALVDAAQKAISFEQILTNAAAKFGEGARKGTKEFEELTKAARKTGAETEFSATQAGEGLNFLAMAGFTAKQSIAALPQVVNLATASQTDLQTATDIATDTLGAFGLAVKDPVQLSKNLSRVNDVLAKTTTTSNTNMEMLFETLKKSGPIATTAGAKIETVAAMAGIMANAGTKAEVAGTTLKNVFVQLSAQTPKAAEALKKLGVATKDEEGNLRDVIDIFEDINKGIQREKLGTAETAEVLATIFGKIPLAGVNVLLEQGAGKLRAYRKELENAGGTSDRLAARMRDTLNNSIKTLMSSIESLQITLFDLNDGAFRKFVESITTSIREIDLWIQNNQKLAASIGKDIIDTLSAALQIISLVIAAFVGWKIITLAFTLFLIGFKGVLLGLKGTLIIIKGIIIALKIAQWLWNLAMSANPIGAVVTAISLLIAGGALLLEYWDPISEFFIDMWAQLAEAFSSGIDFIMGLLEPFLKLARGFRGLFTKFGIFLETESKEKPGEEEAPTYLIEKTGEKAPPFAAKTPKQVVTAGSRITQMITNESSQTSQAELLIRDETNRAELGGITEIPGVKIKMLRSGD